MLPFFRKIRWRLAHNNRFFKYSRYAVGEIVLVVIGILIALQINNWNSERINRKDEKMYLNRLRMNLNRDLTNINASTNRHEERLIVGARVLDSLGYGKIEHFETTKMYINALKRYSLEQYETPNSLGQMLFYILRIRIFYKTDIAFQELLSTGKIDIIKNQRLRSSIQEHYLRISDHQNFQDQIVLEVQKNFRDALNKNNISTLNIESTIEIKDRMTDIQGFVTILENYLNISAAILGLFVYNEDSIKKSTENLIKEIEKELNRSS